MQDDRLKILLTTEKIQERVKELASEIKTVLSDKFPIIVVVLKGAFMFASDLIRHFDFPYEVDFISTSSYGDATENSGVVKLLKDLDRPIGGRYILLVEDIVDTGLTMHYLVELLRIRNPEKIFVVTLLSKPSRRAHNISVDFVGFEIPDEFVVGYGLDYAQKFRGLPYIVTVEGHSNG